MNLLDTLTLLSYLGLNLDIILQARKIHKVRSIEDLSMVGLIVRFFAVYIILYKLICVGDVALIFGQGLIAITFTAYLLLALSLTPKAVESKRKKKSRNR